MTELLFKRDCFHWRSDRPCAPHKAEGVVCASCGHYAPVRTRVLVVKLAAAGDVLRTTSILPALRRRHEGAQVHWVTAAGSAPLLEGNPHVHRVLQFRGHLPVELSVEEFDVLINLDAAPDSAALATAARAREKYGYGLDSHGVAYSFRPSGEEWLAMGVRDDLKRANRRTYQEHAHAIAELEGPPQPPQLVLAQEERAWGRARAAAWGLRPGARVVGLNTGAGGRWPLKRWVEERFLELARNLAASGVGVLLLGGPEEVERNARLSAGTRGAAIDTGCGNTMRQFASIVDLCDVVVSGDTLAMHLATALGKQVVAIFGPTSSAEIDLFGRGEKIVSEVMECLVCYLSACDLDPNCMNTIPEAAVEAAVRRCLER
jgi:lipopolysaccharide heptosyltransferase III